MSDDIMRVLAELNSGLKAVQSGLQTLGEGQYKLRADITSRIDRLQDQLTIRGNDDVVLLGTAERAERIANATREEVTSLSKQVSAMVHQIMALRSRVDHLENKDS